MNTPLIMKFNTRAKKYIFSKLMILYTGLLIARLRARPTSWSKN